MTDVDFGGGGALAADIDAGGEGVEADFNTLEVVVAGGGGVGGGVDLEAHFAIGVEFSLKFFVFVGDGLDAVAAKAVGSHGPLGRGGKQATEALGHDELVGGCEQQF